MAGPDFQQHFRLGDGQIPIVQRFGLETEANFRAHLELPLLRKEDPEFRSRKIGQNGDGPGEVPSHFTEIGDSAQMIGSAAMREVNAHDIDPRLKDGPQAFLRISRRAKRGDYPSATNRHF